MIIDKRLLDVGIVAIFEQDFVGLSLTHNSAPCWLLYV